MIRFIIALWASKLFYWINKKRGNAKDDMPGLLAFKICPDFLTRVGKPKQIITITGTNGKTTTSAIVNNMLTSKGYKVSFNDWGANLHAGYCLNFLRSVSIFNRNRCDVALLEADEMTLEYTMSMIEPDYILVTNICKDSLRRNGHPEFIFDCIENTFERLGSKTTAILNANDPISSELAKNTGCKRIFFGMDDADLNPFENRVKDVAVCPNCGSDIEYNYKHYRHIGDYYCTGCGFKTPDSEYFASALDLDARKIYIKESDGVNTEYPLISDTIFYAFNVLSAVALLRELGVPAAEISDFLASQKITKIRETCIKYNGIEYYTYGTKSQNVSAASTVFEYMAKEPSDKEVVLCLDEVQDKNHPTETLSWLYETDYEFLNSPNIKKIICAGHMYLNHKLRLLLAGVPEEKIFCVEEDERVPDFVDTEGIEKVYVLFEIDYVRKGGAWRDAIVARAMEKNGDDPQTLIGKIDYFTQDGKNTIEAGDASESNSAYINSDSAKEEK